MKFQPGLCTGESLPCFAPAPSEVEGEVEGTPCAYIRLITQLDAERTFHVNAVSAFYTDGICIV